MIAFFLAQWPEGQFVAESVTDGIVGVLCGAKLDGDRASISLLAVDSRSRGVGVGTSLLTALRQACVMEGISTIQLEVRTTNKSAIEFYIHHGFSVSESLPGFYNDGGDGYRMMLSVLGSEISSS